MLTLPAFSALAGQLGALLPTGTQIVQGLAVGAATNVVLKGLQAGGAASLDPLGLFPHPANNPAAVPGATVTASAFASMPASAQGVFLAAGGHIVAG